MYSKGDLLEDYTSGDLYMREILDPEGIMICCVPEYKWEDGSGNTQADALLSHLNRG